MSVSLSLRAYLVDTDATSAQGMRPVLAARGAHTLRGLLRQDPVASTVPWLGGWPVVVHDVGGVNEKVTIVVLADGYALADQRAFEARVQQVTTDLLAVDFFRDNTASFRVVRLGLVSAQSPLSDCHGIKDTAIGLVFTDLRTDAGFDSWTPEIYVRVRKALRTWRLDGDIVMVQVNHSGNWGVFRDGLMALTTGVAPRVLAHELGHAFGLADEYMNSPNPVPYPGTTSPLAPNVTDNVERLTLKWRAFVKPTTPIPTTSVPPGWNPATDVGAFEGGLRDYDTGIYHPALECKMNKDSQPFCPVCADAIGKALRYALDHGGQPQGGGAGSASDVRVLLRVDQDGAHRVIDVSPAWPERLRPVAEEGAAVDVAYVGDEVVGYGPVLADTPSHLFGEDLPEGQVHAVLPHADDVIELRIAADRWPGLDPARLRVGRVVLGDDVGARPWLESVTAASVTEVRAPRLVDDVSALVESVRRVATGDHLRMPAWRPGPQ